MKKNNKNDTSNCIALGLALGLVFGSAFHYPGMGLVFGLCFGTIMGQCLEKRNKKQLRIEENFKWILINIGMLY